MKGKNIYHCLECGEYLTGADAKRKHKDSTGHSQIEWYQFSKAPDDFEQFWSKSKAAQKLPPLSNKSGRRRTRVMQPGTQPRHATKHCRCDMSNIAPRMMSAWLVSSRLNTKALAQVCRMVSQSSTAAPRRDTGNDCAYHAHDTNRTYTTKDKLT